MVDETNVITGHAAFYDHPNWRQGENMCWVKWLSQNFVADKCDVCDVCKNNLYLVKLQLKIAGDLCNTDLL